MGLGATNLSLVDILAETGANSANDNSFKTYNSSSWAQGPNPGDGTETFWGSGVKSGGAIGPNILYNPYNNGANSGSPSFTPGVSNNYKFGFFQNYYGYMDGSNYLIELYVENNIAPATRPDPPNNVDFDLGLYNAALTSGSLAAIFAGNVQENGGTFGPLDVSNPNTFNVNYLYVTGGYNNTGNDTYQIDIVVNGNLQYTAGGVPGGTPQAVSYNDFVSTPLNNGNGFLLEVFFA
jgi:hypothetical protein